jgi:hypothetical protein
MVVKFDPSMLQMINRGVIEQGNKKRLVLLTHLYFCFYKSLKALLLHLFAPLKPIWVDADNVKARRMSSECIPKDSGRCCSMQQGFHQRDKNGNLAHTEDGGVIS